MPCSKPQEFDYPVRVVSLENLKIMAQAASCPDYWFRPDSFFPDGLQVGTIGVTYNDVRNKKVYVEFPTFIDDAQGVLVVLCPLSYEQGPLSAWVQPWQAFLPLMEAAKYLYDENSKSWKKESS